MLTLEMEAVLELVVLELAVLMELAALMELAVLMELAKWLKTVMKMRSLTEQSANALVAQNMFKIVMHLSSKIQLQRLIASLTPLSSPYISMNVTAKKVRKETFTTSTSMEMPMASMATASAKQLTSISLAAMLSQ